ncbi:DUF5064 family protein [Pseudomonas azotifigens]|uniref:DUF5064 family protein n=1 Tax=Stutzerimonas azotifigens TaxID=291995 RepID=A0ABR5Z0G4_9GAMM|nr:DUF5064 family protein [Stutzerimonas azotifigens]
MPRPAPWGVARCVNRGGAFVFRPGHVEVSRPASAGFPGYHLILDYHVEGAEPKPEWACFHLHGVADQTPVDERFSMHRDVAFNFLHRIRQCLLQHGVHLHTDVLFGFHAVYDPLFEDLRHQLHGMPGEPVDLERFLREE